MRWQESCGISSYWSLKGSCLVENSYEASCILGRHLCGGAISSRVRGASEVDSLSYFTSKIYINQMADENPTSQGKGRGTLDCLGIFENPKSLSSQLCCRHAMSSNAFAAFVFSADRVAPKYLHI